MKRKALPPEAYSEKGRIKRRYYEAELARLQEELVKLQYWVKERGMKVVIVFEGRGSAGKGGVIKRITERMSPRIVRVVALPTPRSGRKASPVELPQMEDIAYIRPPMDEQTFVPLRD